MKNGIIQIIGILIPIITLQSCVTHYYINVRQDGSSTVDVTRGPDPDDIKLHFESEYISNIDTMEGRERIKFDISNIEYLGNYLPLHPPGFFEFSIRDDTLIVSDGYMYPFVFHSSSCCGIMVELNFDRKIQSIYSDTRRTKKKGDKTVQVFRTRTQLIKGRNKLYLRIIF